MVAMYLTAALVLHGLVCLFPVFVKCVFEISEEPPKLSDKPDIKSPPIYHILKLVHPVGGVN